MGPWPSIWSRSPWWSMNSPTSHPPSWRLPPFSSASEFLSHRLLWPQSGHQHFSTYKKLVTALCVEHGIPMIKVDSNTKLGEWAGLCKLDQDGLARKVVKCSGCVVMDWGRETVAHQVVLEYLKCQG